MGGDRKGRGIRQEEGNSKGGAGVLELRQKTQNSSPRDNLLEREKESRACWVPRPWVRAPIWTMG